MVRSPSGAPPLSWAPPTSHELEDPCRTSVRGYTRGTWARTEVSGNPANAPYTLVQSLYHATCIKPSAKPPAVARARHTMVLAQLRRTLTSTAPGARPYAAAGRSPEAIQRGTRPRSASTTATCCSVYLKAEPIGMCTADSRLEPSVQNSSC